MMLSAATALLDHLERMIRIEQRADRRVWLSRLAGNVRKLIREYATK